MAMDNRAGSIFGLVNPSYGASDPGMNVPLTSNPGLSQLSPYLNFDPGYLQATQPEFIALEGQPQTRGRFELAFSQIGGSCVAGGVVGGGQGLYRGLIDTHAAGHAGKIRRTQLLNYVMKRGSASANTLGVVAFMYSGLGWLAYAARGNKEDAVNTVAAATLTGLIYKSSAGLRKCAAGGVLGLGLSLGYVAWPASAMASNDKRPGKCCRNCGRNCGRKCRGEKKCPAFFVTCHSSGKTSTTKYAGSLMRTPSPSVSTTRSQMFRGS
ncbi:Mitochondrial import inner membrane translocase subunit Tim23 [Chionoecetes opilio]|uniref:Mitochondrial import inner membrane translocase subunit Tim23 n=1 Tax=Chionoecetes opilio TaxID=41210 RepID=A0A8J4Y943_CHIOP|nr:Mitochondrial import inner membrane translocase subunit Tim23 [Chionoecetes opilio]